MCFFYTPTTILKYITIGKFRVHYFARMHLHNWVNSPLSGAQAFCVQPSKNQPQQQSDASSEISTARVLFLRRVHNFVSFQLRLCVQRFSKKPPEREGSKNTTRRERSTRCKDTLRLFYTLSRLCRIALRDDLTEISFGQSWLATRPETLPSLPNHFLPLLVVLKRENSPVYSFCKEE
jgi:hypothetical protein